MVCASWSLVLEVSLKKKSLFGDADNISAST